MIMKCPVCNLELRMTYRDDVEVDYCLQCRGVCLDRGELEKIVERASTQAVHTAPTIDHDQRPRDRYDERRDSRDEGSGRGYEKKKRSSWLSELFEFGD